MIKYFVRTTNERQLHVSYYQIDYELLVDKEHKPVESFISQIKMLAKLNEDIVILEDDLILCRNFSTKIEEIIKLYKDKIITFFYQPKDYIHTGKLVRFIWHQCVYYPKQIVKQLAENIEQIYEHSKLVHYDMLVFLTLKYTVEYYTYRPCLVQHLDFNTLIQDRTYRRNTPYFIDYLDDLNIPYENAKEYKQELIEYMNKHLEQVRKEMNIDG